MNTPNHIPYTLSGAYIDDSVQIDSVGHPVRIVNQDSINGSQTDWTALVNDSDADGDGVFGIQLTDAQRQELANTITDTDGLRPYDLGVVRSFRHFQNLMKVKKLDKIKSDWQLSNDTLLIQQLQYRDYESEFVRQTGAYNIYWNRNGEINANPRAPLVIDDVLYPFAARRQEYRRQYADEQSIQYFADLKSNWSYGGVRGEHLVSANFESRDIHKVLVYYDADGTSADNAIPYILDTNQTGQPETLTTTQPSLRNYDKKVTAMGISLSRSGVFHRKPHWAFLVPPLLKLSKNTNT